MQLPTVLLPRTQTLGPLDELVLVLLVDVVVPELEPLDELTLALVVELALVEALLDVVAAELLAEVVVPPAPA